MLSNDFLCGARWMKPLQTLLTCFFAVCAVAAFAQVQAKADAMAGNLAPSGVLRVAINFGNPVLAQVGANSDEPLGVSAALARRLGRRLSVPVVFVPFTAAGKVVAAAQDHAWDLAFLAIDSDRAATLAFSHPYVLIEGAYLVPGDSRLQTLADVDRVGVRVAVGKGSAYHLFLQRSLKNARLVELPSSASALDALLSEGLDAAAGVRQPVEAYARQHPPLRVLPDAFMTIRQALAVPRERSSPSGSAGGADLAAKLRYLNGFIEEMKDSGFVAKALSDSHQTDVGIAPATPQ